MDSLDCRLLSMRDLPAILLVEAGNRWRWTASHYEDSFASGHRVLGAEAAFSDQSPPELHAIAVLSQVLDEVTLLNFSVHPARQGKGLGRAMLQRVIEDSRQQGGERLLLEVRESNRRAIHLYESAGFQRDGCRKGYYPGEEPGQRENALLYSLPLAP